MYDDRIYYEDQTNWANIDRQGLWRYLNRLFLSLGPSDEATPAPDSLSARIQARRTGKRDDEIAALDLSRMSEDTRYLVKHMLIRSGRYETTLERFENLRGLDDVGSLDHPLVLDDNPTYAYPYYTSVGILL